MAQFEIHKVKREVIKAYAGFSMPSHVALESDDAKNDEYSVISTGNWGCGVFGGNVELKMILQWISASLAGRKIQYYGFNDQATRHFALFSRTVLERGVTVGQAWRLMVDYSQLFLNEPGRYPSLIGHFMNHFGVPLPRERSSSSEESPERPRPNQFSRDVSNEPSPMELDLQRKSSFDDNELDIHGHMNVD